MAIHRLFNQFQHQMVKVTSYALRYSAHETVQNTLNLVDY